MSDELVDRMDKANLCLSKAHAIMKLGYSDEAGRLAYLAGFHSAQAYIYAKGSKVAKTHKGVHNKFYLLIEKDERFDDDLKCFLSRTYEIKAIADYEYGPSPLLPAQPKEPSLPPNAS